MGALGNSKTILASNVANGGTVTVPYPAGLDQEALTDATGGSVAINENDIWPEGEGAGTVAFSYGASNITITNNTGVTWAAGSTLLAGFGETSINGSYNLTWPKQVQDKVLNAAEDDGGEEA